MPMNSSRAATAIVQSRGYLERARAQISIAVEILSGHDARAGRLEGVLERLETAHRELAEAWSPESFALATVEEGEG